MNPGATIRKVLLLLGAFFFVFCDASNLADSRESKENPLSSAPHSLAPIQDQVTFRSSQSAQSLHQNSEIIAAKGINPAATILPWNLKITALWVGIFSGYNRVQANFLGDGAVAGVSLDLMLGQIGVWATFATGQGSTKTYNLQTADYSISLKEGGTVGLLSGRAGLSYSYELFPKLLISLGVGVEYTRYNTAYIKLGPIYSPVIIPGVSYDFSKNFSVGIQTAFSRATIPNVTANDSQYSLSIKEDVFAAQFIITLRYRFL